jgi:uncharacterized membrane protein
MIDASFDPIERLGTIVLRPNRSWTWRANRYLVYSLMTISGLIGIGFTLRGLWLVLPFTCLEMTVLLGCLYYCVRRTHQQEVLVLSSDELILQTGHDRLEHVYRYPRFFTRFRVDAPTHPWYSSRIRLESRGNRHDIGDFLTGEEKRELVRHVRDVIHRLESAPRAVAVTPSLRN